MRANEMTKVQMDAAANRTQKADAILADYQEQYGFELPVPWQKAIGRLLLGGLSDPELHLIFQTYHQVEGEAGRMNPKPVDMEGFIKDWKAE